MRVRYTPSFGPEMPIRKTPVKRRRRVRGVASDPNNYYVMKRGDFSRSRSVRFYYVLSSDAYDRNDNNNIIMYLRVYITRAGAICSQYNNNNIIPSS